MVYFMITAKDEGASRRIMNHLANEESVTFARSRDIDELVGFGHEENDDQTDIPPQNHKTKKNGFDQQIVPYEMPRHESPLNMVHNLDASNFPENVEELYMRPIPRKPKREPADSQTVVVPATIIHERSAGNKTLRSLAKKPVYSEAEEVTIDKGAEVECAECGVSVEDDKTEKENHAITHTTLQRFGCGVRNCTFKTGNYSTMLDHHMHCHNNAMMIVKRFGLTRDETALFEVTIAQCFPNKVGQVQKKTRRSCNRSTYSFECQDCHRMISSPSSLGFVQKRLHAIGHTDFLLYGCSQRGCNFKCRATITMVHHKRRQHRNATSCKSVPIKLTDKQNATLTDLIKKCFPSNDDLKLEDDEIKVEEDDDKMEEEVEKEDDKNDDKDKEDVNMVEAQKENDDKTDEDNEDDKMEDEAQKEDDNNADKNEEDVNKTNEDEDVVKVEIEEIEGEDDIKEEIEEVDDVKVEIEEVEEEDGSSDEEMEEDVKVEVEEDEDESKEEQDNKTEDDMMAEGVVKEEDIDDYE